VSSHGNRVDDKAAIHIPACLSHLDMLPNLEPVLERLDGDLLRDHTELLAYGLGVGLAVYQSVGIVLLLDALMVASAATTSRCKVNRILIVVGGKARLELRTGDHDSQPVCYWSISGVL